MEKERSLQKKKRPVVWIGLIVLVILVGALIWQTKSQRFFCEPAPAPAPVRVKVPSMPPALPSQTSEPAADPNGSARQLETTPPRAAGAVTQVAGAPEQNDSQPTVSTPEPIAATVSVADANAPAAAAQSEPIAPDPGKGLLVENQPMPQPAPTSGAAAAAPQPASPAVIGRPEVILQKTEKEKEIQPVPPASAPQADLAATAHGPDTPAPYTIQVGSYLTKTYAENTIAALTKRGYEPSIFGVADAKQRKWHVVCFGHFETYKQAAQSLSEFKENENMDGIIIRRLR